MREFPLIFRILLLLLFAGFSILTFSDEKKWDSEYQRLKVSIEKNFSQPNDSENQLEPYLRWMELKAKDRDDVKVLLDEAARLSSESPQDEMLKIWFNRFRELLQEAQNSGRNTVNGAVLKFMRISDPKYPKHSNWQEVLYRLQNYGRQILLKAEATGFVTPDIRKAAKCMLNYSIRDVEANPYGFGVYEGRESEFNPPANRDFDLDCEPRSSFSCKTKGELDKPTDIGLSWIDQIRQESRWWQMTDEENQATELMEEFYMDSMCKVPPNQCNQGHRYYQQMAKKYKLPRSLEYNNGFYATLLGKVEIVSSSGRKPASGAIVSLKAPLDGETWTAKTDQEGRYEMKKVLLHKECQPLEISVRHGQDEVWDYFLGSLTKPDSSFCYEKNLELNKGDIIGRIHLRIHYRDETKSHPYTTLESSCTINGIWKYKADESRGNIEFYRPEPLKVYYHYRERAEDLNPHPECPSLEWHLEKSNQIIVSLSPSYDLPHIMGRIVIYRDIPLLGSWYELGIFYENPVVIPGKKRASGSLPSSKLPPPHCTDYNFSEKEIGLGPFIIRATTGANGEMQGAVSWTSCGRSDLFSRIFFSVDQIKMGLLKGDAEYSPAKSKTACSSGSSKINVEWFFRKIKK